MLSSYKVKIVILAGGKGTRMQHDLPKVLIPLQSKPMIQYLLRSVEQSAICEKPCIVIGYARELVKKELGDKYYYAVQEEQLGTGHAVLCAEKYIKDADSVLVLYGDNPYITPGTIQKLAQKHSESKNKITMATVQLPDFKDWRAFFYKNFSRIIRDKNGKILKSTEFRDASDEEKKVTEVNPCYFCFNAKWLLKELKALKNNNVQKEYYLTDLVKIAIQKKENIESIIINPNEALAINSKDELELVERIMM